IERFVKDFAFVDFGGADDETHALPGKILQLLRDFRQRFGDGRGGTGAIVGEEIAVLEPDGFAAAEEGQGLERFAEFGESFESFAAIADGGVDDLMVHAAEFFGPLLIHLPGALFDGEFVLAKDEQYRSGGLGGGGHFKKWGTSNAERRTLDIEGETSN